MILNDEILTSYFCNLLHNVLLVDNPTRLEHSEEAPLSLWLAPNQDICVSCDEALGTSCGSPSCLRPTREGRGTRGRSLTE